MNKLLKQYTLLLCVLTLVFTSALNGYCDDIYSNEPIDISSVPTAWIGEYDGSYGDTVVRRSLELIFTNISDSGEIEGTAIVSPSDKSGTDYGVNGSYLFKGNIDLATGLIFLQGYEWIDYPVGTYVSNFAFIGFSGRYYSSTKLIDGATEKGMWSMHERDYNNIDTSFTLGVDNNAFIHLNKQNDDGFYGIKNYKLDRSYLNKLFEYTDSTTDKSAIKYAMKQKWNGSCYGIAATMGLLYNGLISTSDLTDNNASSYFDLPLPYQDKKLLNTIQYYHLSQYLLSYGSTASTISMVESRYAFDDSMKWYGNRNSISVFL